MPPAPLIWLPLVAAAALAAWYAIRARRGAAPARVESKEERRRRLERDLHSPNMERRKSAVLKMSLLTGEADLTAANLGAELRNISGDPELRALVAASLGNLREKAAPALGDLRVALKDRNPTVRRAAIVACGQIGPAAEEALPELSKCLHDGSADIRRTAALTMASLGMTNAEARQELVRFLEDQRVGDWSQKFKAAEYLAQHAEEMAALAVPALLRALQHDDREVRRQAPKVVASFGPSILPVITEAARSDKTTLRWGAVVAAGKLGAVGVPLLLPALHDADESIRYEAVRALGHLEAAALPQAKPMLALLEDASQAVRGAATKALARLGTGVLPPLVEALRDKGEYLRKPAYELLAELGAPAVEPLAALLDSPDAAIRRQVVGCLAALQTAHPDATAHIRRAEGDADPAVRKEAAFAMTRSGKVSTSHFA